LSPSLVSALVSIECHGPITLGQLAAHELVKPPSVTRLVAGSRPVKWCTSLTAGSSSLRDAQAAIIATSIVASGLGGASVLAITSRLM